MEQKDDEGGGIRDLRDFRWTLKKRASRKADVPNYAARFSDNLKTRVLRTRSSPNWLGLLERPAHAATVRGVVPTTQRKESEHEQIYPSIACYMALSIPFGVGAEVSVPDAARADR